MHKLRVFTAFSGYDSQCMALDEFEAKVKETHHGNKHERDYLALIQFVKVKFEL